MESYNNIFHKNPSHDPITGKKITIGSNSYKQLVKEYSEPKICSPKPNALITVGKIVQRRLYRK